MSHWSIVKVRIEKPNAELLRMAASMAAKELGLKAVEVGGEVRFKYRAPYADLRVMLSSAEVMYDAFYVPEDVVERLRQSIVKHYTALAVQASLRSLGYQVTSNVVGDKVFIRAVM